MHVCGDDGAYVGRGLHRPRSSDDVRIGGRPRVGFPPFSDPNRDVDPTLVTILANQEKPYETQTWNEQHRINPRVASLACSSRLMERTEETLQEDSEGMVRGGGADNTVRQGWDPSDIGDDTCVRACMPR